MSSLKSTALVGEDSFAIKITRYLILDSPRSDIRITTTFRMKITLVLLLSVTLFLIALRQSQGYVAVGGLMAVDRLYRILGESAMNKNTNAFNGYNNDNEKALGSYHGYRSDSWKK